MNSIAEVAAFLRSYDSLTLISHVSPDGDTLGSVLGLSMGLTRMGKQVQLVCEDPVPQVYSFLEGAEKFISPERAVQTETVVTVDCADVRRTGSAQTLFERASHTMVIDHHMTNPLFGDVNYVHGVAATGELVFDILEELGVAVDAEIAVPLYTAIACDTGNFAFSNVTKESFLIASRLRETGFDLPGVNRKLFRTFPARRMRLRARTLANMELLDEGRYAVTTITMDEFAACGASAEDSEGLIDDLRDIDTVEVAALLREAADGRVRVSMRGKSEADVSRVAVFFDGGGHKLAAGCTMDMPIMEAKAALSERILDLLAGRDF